MLFKFSTLASLDKQSAKGYYVHMHGMVLGGWETR